MQALGYRFTIDSSLTNTLLAWKTGFSEKTDELTSGALQLTSTSATCKLPWGEIRAMELEARQMLTFFYFLCEKTKSSFRTLSASSCHCFIAHFLSGNRSDCGTGRRAHALDRGQPKVCRYQAKARG